MPGTAAARVSSKKVVIDFPASLFTEAEIVIAELDTSRSKFVRMAVERFLTQMRREKLEAQLAAGYIANAQMARETAEEFLSAESELP